MNRHTAIVLAACCASVCAAARAELRVHHAFDSNMVLQRE